MTKSKFIESQIAFILRQSDEGTPITEGVPPACERVIDKDVRNGLALVGMKLREPDIEIPSIEIGGSAEPIQNHLE